ncbi:hypothetical protein PVAND_011032 [Polypedilum vanderplanki]|uniref:Ankyrin repeat protein n=1 Tax=Polypedilum vanderplanki TaxID=319348 RepID=A0A9J6CIB8_POLVA|nr:hypothetical protein PVAND_011032 [Polypedilum vanderplanki]
MADVNNIPMDLLPSTINIEPDFKSFISKFKSLQSKSVFCILDIELISVKKIFTNEFIDSAYEKFKTEVIIKLPINNIKEDRITVTFDSTNSGTIAINWKNTIDQNFIKLELDTGYSPLIKSFIVEFLINSLKSNRTVKFTNSFNQLTNLIDERGFNLLMVAVENENIEILQELLKMPFNINHKSKGDSTAADIAWQKNNQEILLLLLKANSTYPKSFDKNQCIEEVKVFLKINEDMHDAIVQENQVEILRIRNENKSLRHFYNSSNVSATAIAFSKIGIYKLLIGNNCSIGQLEDANQLINNQKNYENYESLNDYEQDEPPEKKFRKDLVQIHKENFKKLPMKHILVHLSNLSFGHDENDAAGQLNLIREAFERVDSILEGSFLLQINAIGQKITNNFDFTRKSLKYMVPTVGNFTNGLFKYIGEVYFAALKLLNDNEKTEVDGVIMHEHGHCGINKVFRNSAKPYAKGDNENEIKFNNIIKEYHDLWCRDETNFEPIVGRVFKCYNTNVWAAELIVRVPHMLGHYQNDQLTLNKRKENFKSLFTYYDEIVMDEMKKALTVLKKLANDSKKITFGELTEPYKAAIRHTGINFQDQKILLKDITNENVLNQLTSKQIKDIFNGEMLNIGRNLENSSDIYKERQFLDVEFKNYIWRWNFETNENELTDQTKAAIQDFNSILTEVNDTKCFLLSGHAGEGKTTTMKKLALKMKEKMPECWITVIDLKSHTEIYEKYQNQVIDSKEKILEYLSELLKVTEGFEAFIFKNLFMSGKIILLFDGMDEIFPNYEVFFLNLIKNIKSMTQYIDTLKKNLSSKTYKFLPFDENRALDFINEYIKSKTGTIELKQIKNVIRELEMHDNPLLLTMVADLHIAKELLVENINKYSLYEKTIRMKKKILSKKGEVANEDRDVDSKINLWEIHQIFALKEIFRKETFYNYYKYQSISLDQFKLFQTWKEEKYKWSPDTVSRTGLITVNDLESDYKFVHRTYAEFYVTKFIIENILEVIEQHGNELKNTEFELRINFGFHVLRKCCDNVFYFIRDFFSDYFKNRQHKINFCKRFCDFIDQERTREMIEKYFGDFPRTGTNYLLFIASVLKYTNFDERIFNILTFTEKGRSKLFSLALNYNETMYECIKICAEFFDVFKKSNLPNWHQLTGLGLGLSENELKLPADEELENFIKNDFLMKNEVIEGYVSGILEFDELSYEEEQELMKKVYQFLCFILKIDVENQKYLEKFFQGDKGTFANILNTCGQQIAFYSTHNLKLSSNFNLFFIKAESFFEDERNNMKLFLSEKILFLGIHTEFNLLKDMFEKYYGLKKLPLLTIKTFKNLNLKWSEKMINAFDGYSTEISKYSCFFQLFLNLSWKLDLYAISHIIKIYKAVFGDEWRNHIGYIAKNLDTNNFPILSNDELKQNVKGKYLLKGSNSNSLEDKLKKFHEKILNFYGFLCLFVTYEIPHSTIKKFLFNILKKSSDHDDEKKSMSYEEMQNILTNLGNAKSFLKIFHVYFNNNAEFCELVQNPNNHEQYFFVLKT